MVASPDRSRGTPLDEHMYWSQVLRAPVACKHCLCLRDFTAEYIIQCLDLTAEVECVMSEAVSSRYRRCAEKHKSPCSIVGPTIQTPS